MASAAIHSSSRAACARCAAAVVVPRPARRPGGGFLAHAAAVAGRPPPPRGRRQPSRPYASSSSSSMTTTVTRTGEEAAPTPTTTTTPHESSSDPDHPANSAREERGKEEEKGQSGGGGAPPKTSSGAMSRRLEEATEDALLTGGRAGRRAVEDAGFSDELKARLLAKVQDAQFRSEHASAFAQAGLAGGGGGSNTSARAAAAASGPAWTGEESTEDAVRRMLNDAHKPLGPGSRAGGGKPRLPDLQPIDLRLTPASRRSPGERAATAREKAGAYADERTGAPPSSPSHQQQQQHQGRSDEERAAFRREVQERFGPAGRTMPATLTGLASLANERIEDAIARGQFRDIARGAAVARDPRADNPFVDTTEYIMNKMIQRQDLVPPWIEKQQELRRAARVFRARLRADWRRHVARSLAADGGGLAHQLRRARRLARAEALLHPQTAATTTTTAPAADDDAAGGLAEAERRVLSAWATEEEAADATTTMTESRSSSSSSSTDTTPNTPASPSPEKEETGKEQETKEEEEEEAALPRPFRDAAWLAAERAYMEAAVANLNALTRSYNLMAPELAKKPYFSLERELASCYADVAPHVADAIRDRAAAPARSSLAGDFAAKRPGLLDRFGGGEREGAAKVYDSRAPHYGFKEMWRDLFSRGKTG